ncbi:MAG: hypothetical protein Q7T81_03885 [Pseudolabrys sp.]|nr:hypothetical protein [Pseudolabrys sp.]
MNRTTRNAAFLILAAAALMPLSAQAQYASALPPLYPYVAQPSQPYAVQVAPGTYVIQRPNETRQRRHARDTNVTGSINPRSTPAAARTRSKADPALVEELQDRVTGKNASGKKRTIETTREVREKPVVIETKRYVDLPPRVVERYVDEAGKPIRGKNNRVATASADEPLLDNPKGKGNERRVINAEAEITIIGPDRMSIRLFRKGDTRARASAE